MRIGPAYPPPGTVFEQPPGDRRRIALLPPPPKLTVLRDDHWFRPVSRSLFQARDSVERQVARLLLSIPAVQRRALRLATPGPTRLYRAVSKAELDDLKKNGWTYDAGKAVNGMKFATEDQAVATALVQPGGAVIEVDVHRSFPYWKLSRWWNLPGQSRQLAEHIFFPSPKDRFRIAAPKLGDATGPGQFSAPQHRLPVNSTRGRAYGDGMNVMDVRCFTAPRRS